MEQYAQILNYAILFFIVLIAIEYLAAYYAKARVNRYFDTVASLSSGLTNVVKDVLGLSIVIVSYTWFYDKLAIFHPKAEWILYIIAFVGKDFSGYWVHRWSHEINVFWNRHIIHHSSEEFNLSCALRQSVSEIFAIFTFTYIPMAILGVPPQVLAVVAPLHLFAQFWYHTRLIDKMGFLEKFLVTPSHHRVHHSINPIYMDKNYAQIFIIWDKLFGTFQEELKDEKPVYGVTRAVRTWNVWAINYQHLWLLIKDAWRTRSFWDKVRIWFMPTGWRPADVKEKYPVKYTEDIYNRTKYDTEASLLFRIWTGFQLVATLLLMLYMFNHIGVIPLEWILFYGVFIFVSVFAYTSAMDGSIWSVIGETVRSCMGIYVILMYPGWFGIDLIWAHGTMFIGAYIGISLAASLYFFAWDKPREVDYSDPEPHKNPVAAA